MGFWCGGFFGGIASSAFHYKALPLYIGGVAFIIILITSYIIKKYNYTKTEYRFYNDRIEFEEGFFTINKKVIKLKLITEVSVKKGLLQRSVGLGTVYLATAATGTNYSSRNFLIGRFSSSGIDIDDILEPDEAYNKIAALVDQAQNS